MIHITAEQIAAAKASELEAVTAVLAEMEPRIQQHARHFAAAGAHLDRDLLDDLAQVGRIAAWEALDRFEGTTPAEFFVFMDRTISGALSNERRAMVRQGVSQDTAKRFERALGMAGGDPYEAEQVAQSADAMGKERMTADTALAARLSWQGLTSLDAPVTTARGNRASESGEGMGLSIGSNIADTASLSDDLATDTDRERTRQRQIKGYVHTALNRLGVKARSILKGTYGIEGDTPYFGTEHEAEFAEYMGMPRLKDLSAQRANAKNRFRTVYLEGPAAGLTPVREAA